MNLDFAKSGGLIPAVVQDSETGDVLMLGFVNEEALSETLATGNVAFFSRSRKKLWRKGESSGHRLRLVQALVDCDADAVLLRVAPSGPGVCHKGYRSCFFREIQGDGSTVTVAEPTFDPKVVYGERG